MIRMLFILLGLSWSCLCLAHSRWMIPSHTVISGSEATSVVLDMSISNDIFHPDNPYGGKTPAQIAQGEKKSPQKPGPVHPLAKIAQSTKLLATYPDGSQSSDTQIVNLGRKSSASVLLDQNGTYRFELVQDPIYFISFKHASGEPGRVFGIGEKSVAKLPKDAKGVKKIQLVNRVQSFVTRNESSRLSIEPKGQGLELLFKTHPNDLFANESSNMTLLLNGKPLDDTEIKLIRGDTRYRNDRQVQVYTSNNKGEFEVRWPEPGRYLLEAESPQAAMGEAPVDTVIYALYLVLEVFPE